MTLQKKIWIRMVVYATIFILCNSSVRAQIYITSPQGHPYNDPNNIYLLDYQNCELEVQYEDFIRAGRYVGGYPEISIEPNSNTIFLINREFELYAHDDGKRYFYLEENLGFLRGGSVFDLDSNLYISEKSGLYKYSLKEERIEKIIDTVGGAYLFSADLTFYNGSLYGANGTNLIKYNFEQAVTEIVAQLDTVPGSENHAIMRFAGMVPLSSYCDSSVSFLLAGEMRSNTDSLFLWNVSDNYIEALCPLPYVIGVASLEESIHSAPCIVYIDLDEDNSSGLQPFNYQDTTYCYFQEVPITDRDVDLRSPFLIDSISVCLKKELDEGEEYLSVSAPLPNGISWRSEGSCLWLVNEGNVGVSLFEEALKLVSLNHSGLEYTEGLRRIEIVGYAGGESGRMVESYIYAEAPIRSLGPDQELSLCVGEAVNLGADYGDFGGLIWSDNALEGRYVADTTGLDTVYVIKEQEECPNDTLRIYIERYELPEWEQEIPKICPSNSAQFTLDIDTTRLLSVWSTSDTTATQVIRAGERYSFELIHRDHESCRSRYEFTPEADEQEVKRIDTVLCAGGLLVYRDSIIEEAGVYEFEEESMGSLCPDVTRLNVKKAPEGAILVVDPDSCFWDRAQIRIDLSGISDIEWNTGSTDSVIEVYESGVYSVAFIYGSQCSYERSVRILECEGSVIYIPNIFSPNGDGVNDFFKAEGERFSVISMKIYDRYGNMVFESRDGYTGWDGTYRSKQMDEGVYAYQIRYIDARGQRQEEVGTVTLVR